MENDKNGFLDGALRRISKALAEWIVFVDTDPGEMENVQNFLGKVRAEMVQSYLNGIQVGVKRAKNGSGDPEREKEAVPWKSRAPYSQ